MINLRAGTLDDTGRIRPVAQTWTSSAQAWAVVEEDGILSYSRTASRSWSLNRGMGGRALGDSESPAAPELLIAKARTG